MCLFIEIYRGKKKKNTHPPLLCGNGYYGADLMTFVTTLRRRFCHTHTRITLLFLFALCLLWRLSFYNVVFFHEIVVHWKNVKHLGLLWWRLTWMFIEDRRGNMRASLCRGLLCKQPCYSFDRITVTTMSYKNPHQSLPVVVENASGMYTPCRELKKKIKKIPVGGQRKESFTFYLLL